MNLKLLVILLINIVFVSKVNGSAFSPPFSNFSSKIIRQNVIDSRADITHHPCMVQVYVLRRQEEGFAGVDDWHFVCGGALIQPMVVLTAQSCVYETLFYAVDAGTHETHSCEHFNYVTNKRMHPLYIPGQPDYNVAMLKVERPFDLSSKVGLCIICYTQDWENIMEFSSQLKIEGMAVGWRSGKLRNYVATELHHGYFDILRRSACVHRIKEYFPLSGSDQNQAFCTVFCLCKEEMSYQKIPNVCYRENGALLFVGKYLWGISSILGDGNSCKQTTTFLFTKLVYYGIAHWIEAIKTEFKTLQPRPTSWLKDSETPMPNACERNTPIENTKEYYWG
ncbi:uncharacterized protein LOC123296337 [Chrysoperla carnea]|uniref:uncharacterized protein LOC123296337 n=1 Tax=Chrysoperla carnea TaxID=189513 RepID=UPI001D07022A|nr:uncharacterized protein LOC123296337 [Chrysoperla carnea]